MISQTPIPKAITVFTDGSSSGIAAVHTPPQTYSKQTNMTLAQRTELLALIWALELFPQKPVNIYSDSASAYLHTVSQIIQTAFIRHMAYERLFHLFIQLQKFIQARNDLCFIGHIRAHSQLSGPLAVGNEHVHCATRTDGDVPIYYLLVVALSTPTQLAIESHQLHHQNASALWKQFGLTMESACQIKQCHQCQIHLPVPHYGVNPR